MAKGLLLTAPKGSRFWHACADPETGLAEMKVMQESVGYYGAAWGHPETQIEWGDDDGRTFTVEAVIRKAKRPAAAGEALDPTAKAKAAAAAIFGDPPGTDPAPDPAADPPAAPDTGDDDDGDDGDGDDDEGR